MELANGKENKFFTLETEGKNRYYIEDFKAGESKGLNSVYLLAKEVPENSIVLDIGCGQGNFGQILKERNCIVYGIDLDEKALEYAKNSGYYDKIFAMDITNKESDEYKKFKGMVKHIDAIIISDVLEHIVDPTKLVLEYSKLLEEEGIILISVPNVAHIDILLNLMNDKFNYQDMGILDNTHLKFFTKTSFVDWINQINETFDDINFDCEYLGATFYNSEFLNTIKKEYNELFTILENSKNYNGLQILFKLTKISKSAVTLQLKRLQEEPKSNVVEILGSALKGKINNNQNHKLVEGERLWYEQQLKILQEGINWHNENDKKVQEYLKELEKGISWHNENNKKSQDYIKELEERINWHDQNDKNMQLFIEQKENEFENQRNKDKQEILELRKKIFDMENSRSWRWTKFLRKSE